MNGIPVQVTHNHRGSDFWYLSGARRFGQFETAVTYSEYKDVSDALEGTPPKPFGADFNKDIQVSIRYDLSENWTLKIESHSIEGTGMLFNQYGQNPTLTATSWTLWAAKTTLHF